MQVYWSSTSSINLMCFRLHQEIDDFFKWMVPTREEHQMRITVVEKIENCIQVWYLFYRTELHLLQLFIKILDSPNNINHTNIHKFVKNTKMSNHLFFYFCSNIIQLFSVYLAQSPSSCVWKLQNWPLPTNQVGFKDKNIGFNSITWKER